jgi:four helix bundle protein
VGRLKPDFVQRVEMFSHRVVDVAEVLEEQNRSRRIVDQMTGSGTSVGANICETDEALSAADFCRRLGVALKELAEVRYWLRFPVSRGWLPAERLAAIQDEAGELRRIFGAMLAKTRQSMRKPE